MPSAALLHPRLEQQNISVTRAKLGLSLGKSCLPLRTSQHWTWRATVSFHERCCVVSVPSQPCTWVATITALPRLGHRFHTPSLQLPHKPGSTLSGQLFGPPSRSRWGPSRWEKPLVGPLAEETLPALAGNLRLSLQQPKECFQRWAWLELGQKDTRCPFIASRKGLLLPPPPAPQPVAAPSFVLKGTCPCFSPEPPNPKHFWKSGVRGPVTFEFPSSPREGKSA